MNKPTIHIGADHRGYCLKYDLKKYLIKKGYNIVDHGNHQYQADDDYPDFARKVCHEISKKTSDIGILICGSGIGMDVFANKTKCLRSALCWNHQVAKSARNDDDPQILVLPADFITKKEAKKIVNTFLNTPFDGKVRHLRRLKQIKSYEKCQTKN